MLNKHKEIKDLPEGNFSEDTRKGKPCLLVHLMSLPKKLVASLWIKKSALNLLLRRFNVNSDFPLSELLVHRFLMSPYHLPGEGKRFKKRKSSVWRYMQKIKDESDKARCESDVSVCVAPMNVLSTTKRFNRSWRRSGIQEEPWKKKFSGNSSRPFFGN